MPRIKRGIMVKKRHRKLKNATKGYLKTRRASVKRAKDAIVKAGQYAYRDRRRKKREMRQLWILKINAILKEKGLNYSQFTNLLKKNKIELNRKILAELAQKEPMIFEQIIKVIS